MNTIIEEIRKRIKARMDNTDAAGDYDEYADGQGVGLAAALRIIDEVEKERPVPADVKEAANACVVDYADINDPGLFPKYKELLLAVFRAGAVWQRSKPIPEDVQEAAKAYSASVSNGHHFRDFETGYAAGMLAERERLMKEAVVAEVYWNRGNEPRVIVHLPKGSAMPGDKVSVIIIKKEK